MHLLRVSVRNASGYLKYSHESIQNTNKMGGIMDDIEN